MGIDFSNCAAHWSYGGFHIFRKKLANEIGIDLEKMEGFGGSISWKNIKDDIKYLLNHSDCDGCLTILRMKKIIPRLEILIFKWDDCDYDKKNALLLIEGMKDCIKKNKKLIFC